MKEWFNEAVKMFFAQRGYILSRHNVKHRRKWMDRITALKRDRTLLLSHCEACQLIALVAAVEKVPGDMAEVGVAYGASAKLISEHAPHKTLHLFDTFEGLPDVSRQDSAKFAAGQFRSDLEDVKTFLNGAQARFYKGLFPSTAEAVSDRTFSFVHIDVDLYSSTLAALEFFYPRLSPGGILLSHDHLSSDGVDQAFREFFIDKPEPVIELTGYQCMIVKI